MNTEQALNIIEQALEMAQSKGTFTLKDAIVVKQSFEYIKDECNSKQSSVGLTNEDK